MSAGRAENAPLLSELAQLDASYRFVASLLDAAIANVLVRPDDAFEIADPEPQPAPAEAVCRHRSPPYRDIQCAARQVEELRCFRRSDQSVAVVERHGYEVTPVDASRLQLYLGEIKEMRGAAFPGSQE
jgi:hypothetical protein